MYAHENRLTAWHIGIAFVALMVGLLLGPIQTWEHAGLNLYPILRNVGIQSYYQGLTIHGILNALVFTTFFITGFITFTVTHSLKRSSKYPWLHTTALVVMTLGLLITAVPLLLNGATVLFTFYPPLKADPLFYIGLTLVVVGSWITGWAVLLTWSAWKKENPGVQTPLIAFGSLITMVLWQICTVGVAVEMLALNIPWSLGLLPGTDPQLARTLFWFTGHPLVYFWLLPVYISWYGMLPKQAGGKLFSEPLARLAFWLFLLLSTPLGLHHQYVDPGIPAGWKALHAVLTYSVFFPSMLTLFNVVASLEIAGRSRGGKGTFGWIMALPWDEPSFTVQALAGVLFAFGGISGLTNASYDLNLVTHNTAWVPGHFHLTVGTGVAFSFMGIGYWLIPKLAGKELWSKKTALYQAWTWFVGMILMSNALHILGLRYSVPRRSALGVAPYASAEWTPFLIEAALGGTILLVSVVLLYVNYGMTVFAGKKLTREIEMPVAENAEAHPAPAWLDAWRPWLIGAVALVLVAYGPVIFTLVSNMQLTSPGFNKLW